MVHDFSKDNGLSANDLFSLAERYHAFSGSSLQDYTLPTAGGYSSVAGDVEVVQPDEASQMITQFLGGPLGGITTPPLDASGDPLTLSTPVTTVAPSATAATAATSAGSGTTTPTTPSSSSIPSFDPRPC